MTGLLADLSGVRIAVVAPIGTKTTITAIIRNAGGRSIAEGAVENLYDRASKKAPEIVLVDEASADPSSHEFMSEWVTQHGHDAPPVILMATQPTQATVHEAVKAGFGSVIAKPFSARTLAAHIIHSLTLDKPRETEMRDQFLLD